MGDGGKRDEEMKRWKDEGMRDRGWGMERMEDKGM